MTHLIVLLTFYAALVVQVALRYGGAGSWTPNLLLFVGLTAATRVYGGIAWAAAAGLACDALSGRPLGVTMLVATLAAAATRSPVSGSDGTPPWRRAATIFCLIAAVELASRVLAATVSASPDLAAELKITIQVALVTGATAFAFEVARRLVTRAPTPAEARPRTPFAAARR